MGRTTGFEPAPPRITILTGCCSTDNNNGFNLGFYTCPSSAEPTMIGCNYDPRCCPQNEMTE